jgi:Fe-S-cluster containining protein
MAEDKNPCMSCDVEQRCCKTLHDLRLSVAEFEKHFRRHADRLSVLKYSNTFLVSPQNQLPCPYLGENGCRIYDERPIDCRLFPYVLVNIENKRDKIRVTFHKDSDCPHREDLFVPLDEAKELMTRLAREVYGEEKPVQIEELDGGAARARAARLLDRVISRISRVLRAYR